MTTASQDIQSRIEVILAAEEGDEVATPDEGSTIAVEEPDEDEVEAEAEADDTAEVEAQADDEVEDEAEDDESSGPAEIVVEIDGQTTRLTSDEVKAGYLRASDYTRKTQELSAARSAFENAQRQAYEQFEQQLQALQMLQEPEPDWKAIRAEDPLGYIDQKAGWDEKQDAKNKLLGAHRHRLTAQQQQAQAARQQQLQAQRGQLPELIPEWRDPAVMQKEAAELAAFLKADGFDAQDVDNISDAKLVRLVRDAKKYREGQKSKAKPELVKKKIAGKPKVVKPGSTPKGNPESSARRGAFDAARKSQRPQDWAKAFEVFV